MKFLNLTPHDIRVIAKNGADIIIPACGRQARISTDTVEETVSTDTVEETVEVPTAITTDAEITGLPDPQAGMIYVVSMPVAQHISVRGRTDVYCPDTGPTAQRSENGQIKGVRRLHRFNPAV